MLNSHPVEPAAGLWGARLRDTFPPPLHRDLKPENILVERGTDRTMVVDFGLARMVSGDEEEEFRTAMGAITGSPAYIAPETIAGGRVDARTDVYALGTIFFELLTGRTPLHASTPYAFLREHLVGVPLTLERARPDQRWSPDLEALIAQMLAKESAHRPASCSVVLKRLPALRQQVVSRASEPGTFWNRFFRRA